MLNRFRDPARVEGRGQGRRIRLFVCDRPDFGALARYREPGRLHYIAHGRAVCRARRAVILLL